MILRGIAIAAALMVAGGAGYIRLAPSDPALWHVAPQIKALDGAAPGTVLAVKGGAAVRLALPDPAAALARLDAIALASPRTTRLAGSPDEGRITWITRTAVWGFPDYTTAQAEPDGLRLYARQRFGRDDFGVNAARLQDWLKRL
jgi:hypothetical protein